MQVCPSGLSTTLPPPPTVLWKEVTEPTPPPEEGALPCPEDGAAAEPHGASRFPSLSLVYVRLAPWVFIYFMLRAVIQYDSVLLLNLLQHWPWGVPQLAPLNPDTPVRGGWVF